MNTIIVNPSLTLKNAIEQAQPGDQILLEPGHYKEFVMIDKPVTIIGNGNLEDIIFQGSIKITAKVTLENITFDGNFTKVTLHALHINGGKTIVKDCHFTKLNYFGILLDQAATLEVKNTTFTKVNTGIQATQGATLFVENSTFSMNQSIGIAVSKNANGKIQHCHFDNIQQAVIYLSEDSETTVEDCIIHSGNSIAIDVKKAKATLLNCEIYENNGNQVSIEESDVTIKNCTIHSGGETANGISMINSTVEIENSIIYNHWEPQIYAKQSTLSVKDSKIFDSPAEDSAIGISLLDDSHGTIEYCEIFNHYFTQVLVENDSFLTIRHCEIYGNEEEGCHGIYFTENSQGNIEHCEIYQTAEQLYLLNNCEVTVNHTHIYSPLSEAIGCNVYSSKLIMNDCEIEGHDDCQISAENSTIELKSSKIHDSESFYGIRFIRTEVMIDDCDIYHHEKASQINIADSHILLQRSRIYSSEGHGISFENGKGVIKDCLFYENGYSQIDLTEESEVEIINTKIYKGLEETRGLVVSEASTAKIVNCIFSDHDSPQILVEENSKFYLKDSKIMDGRGINSCGIRIIEASGIIEQCEFNNNGEYHIVIEQNSDVTVKDCKIDSKKENAILIHDSKGIITNCHFLQ